MNRTPIPQKLRFEILKRDEFRCQYCGKNGKDAILEVDHIHPVVDGGENHPLNLRTACFDCNRGKGGTPLDEKTSLRMQTEELQTLRALREQQEMMLKWHEEILNFDNQVAGQLAALWLELTQCCHLNQDGRLYLSKLLRKHSMETLVASMHESCRHYLVWDGDNPTFLSALDAWAKIKSFCEKKEAGVTFITENYKLAS